MQGAIKIPHTQTQSVRVGGWVAVMWAVGVDKHVPLFPE